MKNRAIGEFKIQVEDEREGIRDKFPKIIDFTHLFLVFYIYSYYFFLFAL